MRQVRFSYDIIYISGKQKLVKAKILSRDPTNSSTNQDIQNESEKDSFLNSVINVRKKLE